MLRRRSITFACVFASASLFPLLANAQTKGFAVNEFEPSAAGSEWFALDSLDLRGSFRPAIGVVEDWEYRPILIFNSDGTVRDSIVRNQVTTHFGASVVIADRLRLGASLPLVEFADGHLGSFNGIAYNPPANTTSIGDLRLDADLRLVGIYGDPFTLAIGGDVWLPTGAQDSYSGDGTTRVGGHLLAAGDLGPFVYSARAGVRYRDQSGAIGDGVIGSTLEYGISAGFRIDRNFVVGPEIFGNTVISHGPAFAKNGTPVEGLFGMHYLIADQVRIGGGLSTSLSSGFGTPAIRGLVNLEWAPGVPKPAPSDRDHDGILDRDDACPDTPGIHTGNPATDGCPPPPPDRDGDGIIDSQDACPDVPGVRTNDPKTDGCPPDRDHDGIPDVADACPDIPGVANADPKKNGCPPDRDGDGIIDSEDACPDVPGIRTADPKTNGCPDPDRDKDGIPNDVDACPDEPGKPSKDPKRNGCPEAFIREGQIKILDQVKFVTGSAKIVPGKDSEDILEAVVQVMKAHPEIKRVRIEGHTDNVGPAAYNKKLSIDRGSSVEKWLVAHGIDASRLNSTGFGQERPIDTNKTAEGRRNNRRVEFHIAGDGSHEVDHPAPRPPVNR